MDTPHLEVNCTNQHCAAPVGSVKLYFDQMSDEMQVTCRSCGEIYKVDPQSLRNTLNKMGRQTNTNSKERNMPTTAPPPTAPPVNPPAFARPGTYQPPKGIPQPPPFVLPQQPVQIPPQPVAAPPVAAPVQPSPVVAPPAIVQPPQITPAPVPQAPAQVPGKIPPPLPVTFPGFNSDDVEPVAKPPFRIDEKTGLEDLGEEQLEPVEVKEESESLVSNALLEVKAVALTDSQVANAGNWADGVEGKTVVCLDKDGQQALIELHIKSKGLVEKLGLLEVGPPKSEKSERQAFAELSGNPFKNDGIFKDLHAVYEYLKDEKWRTLGQIKNECSKKSKKFSAILEKCKKLDGIVGVCLEFDEKKDEEKTRVRLLQF